GTRRAFGPLADGGIDARLTRAVRAFRAHRRSPFSERARGMRAVAETLERERDSLGRLITTEMGKPLRAAIEEVEKCARACRHYADHAERLLADEAVAP